MRAQILWLFVLLLSNVNGFRPSTELSPIWAGSFVSRRTWERIPYSTSQIFCLPQDIITPSLNLGQALLGQHYVSTSYQFQLEKGSSSPTLLCSKRYSHSELDFLEKLIRGNYCLNLIVGGIEIQHNPNYYQDEGDSCPLGVALGHIEIGSNNVVLYNHLNFQFYVQKKENETKITKIFVSPSSLYYPKNQLSDCSETSGGNQTCGLLYVKPSTQTVLYTYRYEILEDLPPTQSQVPWGKIVFLVLETVLLFLLTYTLDGWVIGKLRIMGGNGLMRGGQSVRELRELTVGVLHQLRDETRNSPTHYSLLSTLVSLGLQLWFTIVMIITLLLFNILTPPFYGSLIINFILIFFISNFYLGYHQTVLKKELCGKTDSVPWNVAKRTQAGIHEGIFSAITSTVSSQFPTGIFFLGLVFWNLFRGISHAYSPIPSSTILVLLCIWCGLGFPLAIIGKFVASQPRPISLLYNARSLAIILIIISSGVISGFFSLIISFVPIMIATYFLTRSVMTCKDRKIVVTPFYVTSMANDSDWYSTAILFLSLGLFPSIPLYICISHYFNYCGGDYSQFSPTLMFISIAAYTICSILSASIMAIILISKKDFGAISWKCFFVSASSSIYLILYFIFYFSMESQRTDATFINVLSTIFLILALTAWIFIMGGCLGFFGCQIYLHRLFQSLGTLISGENAIENIISIGS